MGAATPRTALHSPACPRRREIGSWDRQVYCCCWSGTKSLGHNVAPRGPRSMVLCRVLSSIVIASPCWRGRCRRRRCRSVPRPPRREERVLPVAAAPLNGRVSKPVGPRKGDFWSPGAEKGKSLGKKGLPGARPAGDARRPGPPCRAGRGAHGHEKSRRWEQLFPAQLLETRLAGHAGVTATTVTVTATAAATATVIT